MQRPRAHPWCSSHRIVFKGDDDTLSSARADPKIKRVAHVRAVLANGKSAAEAALSSKKIWTDG
jgi:hypothetical protein